MLNKQKYVLIIIILSLGFGLNAENTSQTKKNIQLIYSTSMGNVRLRWIPASPEIWDRGKNNGYIVEKKTIRENGEFLKTPKSEILTGGAIMPVPLSVWEQVSDTNNYAAIISEAFYGKSFQLYSGSATTSSGATLLNKSKELNDRYVFSLLSAEFSYDIAKMAGWGITDDDVQPDGIYQYSIRLNDPANKLRASDSVKVNMKTKDRLPAPFAVAVKFEENLAQISWQNSYTDDVYSFYQFERSSDGIHFEKINKLPFIPTPVESNNGENTRNSYNDSIPNNIIYHYRIRGITRFGEISPPSEVISGFAQRKLRAVPTIIGSKYITDKMVRLEWLFDQKEEELIDGFEILRSESAMGEYYKVSGLLAPTTRIYDVPILSNNYFIVKAVGREDVSTISGAKMVQVPDFIPPAKPHTPTGTIDSTGVVRLEWLPNTDDDLDGYFVYCGHQKNGGFVKVNPTPIKQTNYVDSINIRLGNEEIIYSIVAVDKVFNNSVNSDPLILNVPDVIKPNSPIFSVMSQKADTVNLKWITSISSDVVMQLLYRKTATDEKWKLQARFDDNKTSAYTDTKLEEDGKYSYLLVAVDDAGLESAPTTPVSFTIPPFKRPGKIEKLTAKFDQENMTVLLKWKGDKNVKAYKIYKEEGEGGPNFLSTVEAGESRYTDVKIKPFQKYTYQIRSVGLNGLYSPFETITVQWK